MLNLDAIHLMLASIVCSAFLISPGNAIGQETDPEHLTVMVWNIQRGANNFDRGPEKALEIIKQSGADVVLLQESYDIDGPRPKLGAWLAEQLGWNAYQGESAHLCVLTRLEITETFYHHAWHGVGARLRDKQGREFVAYSIWLDYRSYTPYALRDNPTISDEALLLHESQHSSRLKQAEALLGFIKDKGHLELEVPLLVGGDFNCPSHLDWTEEAARSRRHVRALPLPVSKALMDAGMKDAYRAVFPDPVKHPGITWSPLYRIDDKGQPETQDRIDRLYLKPSVGVVKPALTPDKAAVLPLKLEDNDIAQAKRRFPSDHGAVVIRMKWELATPDAR